MTPPDTKPDRSDEEKAREWASKCYVDSVNIPCMSPSEVPKEIGVTRTYIIPDLLLTAYLAGHSEGVKEGMRKAGEEILKRCEAKKHWLQLRNIFVLEMSTVEKIIKEVAGI